MRAMSLPRPNVGAANHVEVIGTISRHEIRPYKAQPQVQDLLYQNIERPGGVGGHRRVLPSASRFGVGVRTAASTGDRARQPRQREPVRSRINAKAFSRHDADRTMPIRAPVRLRFRPTGRSSPERLCVVPASPFPQQERSPSHQCGRQVQALVPVERAPDPSALELARFPNDPLQASATSFHRSPAHSCSGASRFARLRHAAQAFLETSNVNACRDHHCHRQRAYEMNSKSFHGGQMLQSHSDELTRLNLRFLSGLIFVRRHQPFAADNGGSAKTSKSPFLRPIREQPHHGSGLDYKPFRQRPPSAASFEPSRHRGEKRAGRFTPGERCAAAI